MARARRDAPEPARLRLHVTISAETRRRLGAYAGAHRLTEAAVVERALEAHLAGFYFGQREPRASITLHEPPADAAGGEGGLKAIRSGIIA